MTTTTKYREKVLSYWLFIAIWGVCLNTYGQNRLIRGAVQQASDGAPLSGATVLIKGSTQGTFTQEDGRYQIEVPSDNATLVFKYVGFEEQEVPVAGRTTIDISMIASDQYLDEIVVIGYGSVKKSDLTGSVSSLKADDLTPGANISVDQMLQGRAPGVLISQKSGEPGSAMSVKIRGASSISASNEPLYVIDGLPVNNDPVITGTGSGFVGSQNPRNPLNSLNPTDIESIEILKDASATAIYGARGANGVVLITTKKGTGGSMRLTYDGYYGIQSVANQLELLNPSQYQSTLNAIIDEGGGNANERVDNIQGSGTDWQAELYRDAPVQSHNLSFSGGTQNSSYFVSLNYFGQDGVVDYSGIDRYTARLNLESRVEGKYAFGINLTTALLNDDFVSNGVGLNENGGAVYAAINYDPTISVFDDNGDFNRSPFITIDNPLALAQGEQAEAQTYNTLGTIYGEYFFLPSLSARVKLGGNISNSRRDVWIDPISLDGQQNGGIATIITGSRSQYLLEGTLNYNDTFGKHRVNGVIGATYERFDSENFNGNGRGYTLPDLQTNAIGSGDPLQNQIGSSKNLTKLASYLGRVNYSFDEKYLVTLSMRADGSSRFGLDNRFGFFPSAAFAWNLHNEAFIGTDNLFSQLKFRASYGVIGNQSIPNYLFLTTFALNNRDVVLEGSRFTAIAPSRAASPDLQWEETNQLDIGIDFGLYNNRIRGTVEYYNRKTTDLLLPVPLPPNSGFNSRIENIGSMRNDGWELFLETFLISTNAFNWTISANLTTINNEVLDIGDAENIITGNLGFVSSASIIRPGDPLNSYYGYVVEGVWQEGDDFLATTDAVAPGDIKYQDLNGDGTINADDRQIIGKPFPDFTWGLTNTLTYKDLSLTVFIEGVHGIELLSNNLVDTYFPINFRRNKIAEPYLNRWTPSNPTNEYPSFVNPTAQGQRVVNTRTVTDASYIRLQTVRLAYNVPVTNSGFFKQLTVFATGQNLATLTDYIGVDPAANALGNNVLRIDYNTYPFARTTMLGLTLGF